MHLRCSHNMSRGRLHQQRTSQTHDGFLSNRSKLSRKRENVVFQRYEAKVWQCIRTYLPFTCLSENRSILWAARLKSINIVARITMYLSYFFLVSAEKQKLQHKKKAERKLVSRYECCHTTTTQKQNFMHATSFTASTLIAMMLLLLSGMWTDDTWTVTVRRLT